MSALPTCTQDALRAGIRRKDGTIARIAVADILTCVIGKEKVLAAQATHVFSWSHDESIPVDTCEQRKTCRASLQAFVTLACSFPSHATPLSNWDPAWCEQLCSLCSSHAQHAHSTGRRCLWEKLPGFFELSDWETLQEMQRMRFTDIFT